MFSRDFQGAYSAGAHFTGERGFEVRTFECSICDPTEQVLDFSWNPMKTDAVGARGRTPAGTLRPSPFVRREVDRAAPSFGARIRYRPYTDGGMSSSVWPLIGSCVAPSETNSRKSGNSIVTRERL